MSHHHHCYSLSLRLILALSACFITSFCKPTIFFNSEEMKTELQLKPLSGEIDPTARKMWREADQNTRHMETPANIIKSLTFVKKNTVEDCEEEFNFTLAAVNSVKLNLQSKLRLYLQGIPPHSPAPMYIIEIKAKLSNGKFYETAVKKEIIPTEDGYVEFDVSDLVRHLISKESHAVFKVQVYESVGESMVQMKCSKELQFVNNDMEDEMMPVLLVYAYNWKLEHVDDQKVTERTRQARQVQSFILQARRKRAISTGCGVQPLWVNGTDIPNDLVGMNSSYTLSSPYQFNAGMCGGFCHGNLPTLSPYKHSFMIHHLLEDSRFRARQGQGRRFSQCCLPVKYAPLRVLGSFNGGSHFATNIPSMIITACACLEIAV